MFRVALVACLLTIAASSDGSDWAWGSSKEKTKTVVTSSVPDSEAQITKAIFSTTVLNGSEADRIVDTILSSKREGRTLSEDAYQQVAQEPALQQALAQGDSAHARSIVKERLCNLGLMACGDEIEGKGYGGHVSPQDVFYAQPVAIKPVGQPIPAVPVRNPHAYRPPPPGFNGGGHPPFNGPVPPPGYNGFPRPGYGPGKRPPPIGASIYGPPKPVPTFELEHYGHKQGGHHHDKDVSASGAVTHVHHHYHHGGPGEGGAPPPPPPAGGFYPGFGKENPVNNNGFSKVPPPVYEQDSDIEVEDPGFGSFGGAQSGGFSGQSGAFGGQSGGFGGQSGGFSGQSGGFSGQSGAYGGQSGGFSGQSGGFSGSASQYGSPQYGASSSQFYKKELSLNKKQPSGNSLSSSYAGQYQGYESPRADNCICVPAQQCPASEVIGRKEDNTAFLIDPRNQGSEIEAEIGTESPETSELVKREDTKENATEKVDVVTAESVNATATSSRRKRQATSSTATNDKTQAVAGARVGRNGKDSPELGAEMAGLLEADDQLDQLVNVERSTRNSSNARDFDEQAQPSEPELRQFGGNYIGSGRCGPQQVCCRRPSRPSNPTQTQNPQCGRRNAQGINGRIKNPVYVDGDSEFGEYPWQAAILKKDAHESVYVCGGTLIDNQHIITAAHCVKGYNGQELRVRLGEWDVNHDVEFYPYIETDVVRVHIHPEFYAGTLINDLAVLKLARPVDLQRNPHISPACMPDPQFDYNGARCYTTGWGKDAFGDFGKYQNILKEVDVPVVSHHQCQSQLQQTRLGYDFKLHPGFVCAGGEEGKDACKGDGGGPMVCERFGSWQVVGVVSWGIGCGQYGVPGVYVRVSHYLDWIRQVTRSF